MSQNKIRTKISEDTFMEETDSTINVVCNGTTMFSVEYDGLIDKWHMTSTPLQLDEIWDYRKGQKEEVIDKALQLSIERCESKLWERKVDRLVDIGHITALGFSLFDIKFDLTYGYIVGCIIFLTLAVLNLLRAHIKRNAMYIGPFIIWTLLAVIQINIILTLLF